MAQIIKHRRGLIGGVKNLTARNGELIIASGSISDLAGPFVFIGSPNAIDEGVAGAFNSVSKLYTGTAAPTITAATYGSALDGTPYYASGNKSLYILNNSNVGNSQIDLTGNIEGNTISGVTINTLNSTNITASFVSASFVGDGTGLYNVPASGVTGLKLNLISSGSNTASIDLNGFNVNTNTSITGTFIASNGAAFIDQGVISQNSNLLLTSGSNLIIQDGGNINVSGNVYITGSEYVDDVISRTGNGFNALHLNGGTYGAPDVELTSATNISLLAEGGTPVVNVTGSLKVTGDATVESDLYVSGNIYQTGSFFTQGSIVLSGSINIGDFTGDTINFGGEVSSSILPAVNNAFDLGGPLNAWNDLYVSGTAYIENINLASISVSSISLPGDLTVSGTTTLSSSVYVQDLTEKRLVVAGVDGLLTDYSGLTFDNGNLNVSGAIEVTDIQGTGSLYLKPDKNDSRLFEIYNTGGNDIHIKGNATYSFFGDDTNYLKLDSVSSSVTLNSDNRLDIESQNGSIYFNDSSNNEIYFQGDTYFNTGTTMYVTKMLDNNDSTNYLELYGNNTNNSSWWESGTGRDTTLYSNETANINILNISGDINISGSNTVNISSVDGTNITGSLVVSDASGVFNSSLIVNNSDLTLSDGSDVNMNDGAILYFNNQDANIYYNTTGGVNELTLYNDANTSIRLDGDVNISNELYVSSSVYTDNILSRTGNSQNRLSLNGGTLNAPNVELMSNTQISLFSEGAGSNYAINMTGSVHILDSADISGSLTVLNNVTASFFTGSFVGDGSNLIGISMTGVTGLDFTKIYDGAVTASISATNGFHVNTNSAFTGSLNVSGSSNLNGALNVTGATTLYSATTINAGLTVTGNTQVQGNTSVTGSLTVASGSATMLGGDLYVSGNLQVLGSSTNVSIESSTVNIGDNIIQVNAYSPFDRYAGLSAYDSGSSGASGSFLWDSTNDYWLIVNANSYSSKIIGTTASTGSTGTEISLTSGVFPIASASNTIEDSLLTYTGTTLAFNTNKFTVESVSGNTAISGNLTLSYSGGTDGGTKTSRVTFRNSSNILGFVSTTETTNELDGILGYNHSTGVLEFSTLIDGGTYS